jgi:hypothetical protein
MMKAWMDPGRWLSGVNSATSRLRISQFSGLDWRRLNEKKVQMACAARPSAVSVGGESNMRKMLRIAVSFVLAGCALHAQAQRETVPVVDFENIPVGMSTSRALSEEQVRQAISAAALLERWDISPKGDNLLQAVFVKDGRHTVVIDVAYRADSYSFTYKDSAHMNAAPPDPVRAGTGQDAAEKQRQSFARNPETRYAVVRPDVLIHPFYETWVHRFAESVSRQIRVLPG